MAAIKFGLWSLCIAVCFLAANLNSADVSSQPVKKDYDFIRQMLVLDGPDQESMLDCTMPFLFDVDTSVDWLVDGKLVKNVFLPSGHLHLYESIEDLADLTGVYPTSVECIVDDHRIGDFTMISNTFTRTQQ